MIKSGNAECGRRSKSLNSSSLTPHLSLFILILPFLSFPSVNCSDGCAENRNETKREQRPSSGGHGRRARTRWRVASRALDWRPGLMLSVNALVLVVSRRPSRSTVTSDWNLSTAGWNLNRWDAPTIWTSRATATVEGVQSRWIVFYLSTVAGARVLLRPRDELLEPSRLDRRSVRPVGSASPPAADETLATARASSSPLHFPHELFPALGLRRALLALTLVLFWRRANGAVAGGGWARWRAWRA